MRLREVLYPRSLGAVPSVCRKGALLSLLAVLLFGLHRDCAAQLSEMDTGEDINFELRLYTVIHTKDGVIREGKELPSSDPAVVRLRQKRPDVVIDIPRSDITRHDPALGPETSVADQFKKHPERIAGVARKAMRVFSTNREVNKLVKGQLELAAGNGDTGAMVLLIQIKLAAGEYEPAENLARQLIARKNNGLAQALLGRALAGQEAKRATADAAFAQALKLSPDDEIVMVFAAEFLLDTGRPEKAREIFASALARNPNSVSALVGAGYVALRQGTLEEAASFFEKTRTAVLSTDRRDKRYINATLGLAATKALQGQYDETRSLANEVLQYDTASARAYALQAYAYLLAGGESESSALPKIDTALRAEPDNPRFKAIKAVALMRQGQVLQATEKADEARARLEESVKLLAEIGSENLNDSWAAYLLGEMLFNQQQYDRALALFQRAASLTPNYAPAYQAVGATALALKQWKEAEAAYRKTIELDGENAEYHACLGLAILGQGGRLQEALEILKKAWGMDKSNVEALCGLGYIANTDKNENTMRELFHQALASDGDCSYAAEALRKLYAFRKCSMEYLTFSEGFPKDWAVARGAGRLRPDVLNGVLQWRGTQATGVNPRVDFCTTSKAEEFVRLEADFFIKPDTPTTMGLRVGSAAGNVAFYLEFGKDESNRLAYRLQDYRGLRDWTEIEKWPESGKVRLCLESPDLSSGQINLYVNGERKLSGKLELARPGRISAGVFLQAPAAATVDAYVDNIVHISRKPTQLVNEDTPTEFVPTEQPKHDTKAPDAKTPDGKTPDNKATPGDGKKAGT